MAVLLYAICSGAAAAPRGLGRDAQPLRMVRADGLAAVLSDRVEQASRLDEAALWEHERVVEQLMCTHDLLPARFDSTLASDCEARSLLHDRDDELRTALAWVADAVELSVRAGAFGVQARTGSVAQSEGAAYLGAALKRQRRSLELSQHIRTKLDPIARDRRVVVRAGANVPLRASYLVTRERVEGFARRVSDLNDEIADAEIVCTGPWPPYSFSERNGARC